MRQVMFAFCALQLALYARHTSAQVVQLPTFQFFGMSTTVSVPDQGSISLGGNASSSMSGFDYGFPGLGQFPIAGRPFGDRAIASHTQSSGVSVSAYIHDFEAMDQALLGEGVPLTVLQSGPSNFSKVKGSRPIAEDAAGRMSVAQIRRQGDTAKMNTSGAARRDLERARQLLAEGKTGVARAYLQHAVPTADPKLRAEIAALERSLSSPVVMSQNRDRNPSR
jgi:hypothetical protein